MPRTNGLFELSDDVRVVVSVMRQAEPGAIVERAAIAAKLGRDPGDRKLNSIMRTARHVLLREEHVNFDTVPKVGWRRMEHGEVASKVSETARRSIHATAKRADQRIVAAINSGGLNADEMGEAVQKRSLNRLFVEVTRPKTYSKLEARTTSSGSTPIPTQKMLDHMKEVC